MPFQKTGPILGEHSFEIFAWLHVEMGNISLNIPILGFCPVVQISKVGGLLPYTIDSGQPSHGARVASVACPITDELEMRTIYFAFRWSPRTCPEWGGVAAGAQLCCVVCMVLSCDAGICNVRVLCVAGRQFQSLLPRGVLRRRVVCRCRNYMTLPLVLLKKWLQLVRGWHTFPPLFFPLC